MNPNGENNEKNMVNDQNLEQVSGGTDDRTALYRCPVCQHEETRTTSAAFPDTIRCCVCGAYMKRVPGSITRIVD